MVRAQIYKKKILSKNIKNTKIFDLSRFLVFENQKNQKLKNHLFHP